VKFKKTTTVTQVAHLGLLSHRHTACLWPIAFILFLSLPVTVASAERSFQN